MAKNEPDFSLLEEITSENEPGTDTGEEDVDWEYVGIPDGNGSWSGKKRRKIV